MLTKLFRQLIYGGTTGPRSYELACLEHLRAALPPAGQSILDRQIASIQLVQRFSQERLVRLHFLDNTEGLPLFPNREDECRAARIGIQPRSSQRNLTLDVVFHRGKLAVMEYSSSPTVLAGEAFSVEHVQLLQDLLQPQRKPEMIRKPLGTLLSAIDQRFAVRDVLAPASEARISVFLEPFGAVPSDYSGLLRETDGFSVLGWRFNGTKARRLLTHDDLWLVAESAEAAICLRQNAREPSVFYLDEINDECSPLGTTFVGSFLEVLSMEAAKAEETR